MENKKTTSLTLRDVYELEAELNGFSFEGKQVFEGVLNQKINFVTKYHLKKLYAKVKSEKDLVDDMKNELIRKYGTEKEGGSVVIEPVIVTKEVDEEGKEVEKREINEDFRKFQEEYQNLLMQVKDFEHYPFTVEEFSELDTNDNYDVFYRLFD